MIIIVTEVDIRMFLEWEGNSGKLKIISRKFQNHAINDVKQISLSHVIMNINLRKQTVHLFDYIQATLDLSFAQPTTTFWACKFAFCFYLNQFIFLLKMSFKFKIPINHFYTNRKVCIKYCTTCLWALGKVIVVKNSNKLTLCNYTTLIFLLAEILSSVVCLFSIGSNIIVIFRLFKKDVHTSSL